MFTALEIARCGCRALLSSYSVLKDQKQLVYRVQFIFFSGENISNDFLDCIAAEKSVELAFTCGDVRCKLECERMEGNSLFTSNSN